MPLLRPKTSDGPLHSIEIDLDPGEGTVRFVAKTKPAVLAIVGEVVHEPESITYVGRTIRAHFNPSLVAGEYKIWAFPSRIDITRPDDTTGPPSWAPLESIEGGAACLVGLLGVHEDSRALQQEIEDEGIGEEPEEIDLFGPHVVSIGGPSPWTNVPSYSVGIGAAFIKVEGANDPTIRITPLNTPPGALGTVPTKTAYETYLRRYEVADEEFLWVSAGPEPDLWYTTPSVTDGTTCITTGDAIRDLPGITTTVVAEGESYAGEVTLPDDTNVNGAVFTPIVDAAVTFVPPPNSRIEILDTPEGEEPRVVWAGITRLLPALVSPIWLAEQLNTTAYDVAGDLVRASLEALGLWACELPTKATASMQEYVLGRLSGARAPDSFEVQIGSAKYVQRGGDSDGIDLDDVVARLRACVSNTVGRTPLKGRSGSAGADATQGFDPGPFSPRTTQTEKRLRDNWRRTGPEFRRRPR